MGSARAVMGSATVVALAATSLVGSAAPASARHLGSTITLSGKPTAISGGGAASRLPRTTVAVSASFDTSQVGARWTVFERFNRTPNLGSYGGNLQTDSAGDLVAIASNHKHTRHVFGIATDVMGEFSSVGKVVTAIDVDTLRVYWWANPFKTSPRAPQHSYVPPKNHSYQTSAPDGWIETDGSGHVYDVNAKTGTERRMGWPFPNKPISVTSGPTGIVVTSSHGIAFIKYGSKTAHPLDTSLIGDTTTEIINTPRCTSVSTRYAACGNRAWKGDDYDPAMSNLFLDPLDGSTPIDVVTFDPNLDDDNPLATPAVYKKSLAWESIESDTYGDLAIKDPGVAPRFGPTVASPPIAAPGGFLATNVKQTGTLVIDRQLKSRRLVANSRSRVESLTLAVGHGAIAWSDDRDATDSSTLRLRRRAITGHGSTRSLGPVSTVGANAQRSPIAASAHYTVYAKGTKTSYGFGRKLVVIPASRSESRRTVENAVTRYEPTLSGHRLLYSVSQHKVAVVDLKTGTTKTYSAISAALDGDHLVIATRIVGSQNQDATIHEVDLTTGSSKVVEPDVQMYDGWKVFVHGSIVGWQAIGSPQHHYEPMSQYRDMATLDTVVTLPLNELLWSFTDAGMLLETRARSGLNPGSFPYDNLGDVAAETFLLRPYGSTHAHKVLSGHFLHSPPQIADGVVAWIDRHGRVEARRLG